MSFRERSAWMMGALMLLAGLAYAWLSRYEGEPVMGLFLVAAVAMAVLSIAVQVALAISTPKEARAPADERERLVIDRAGRWGGLLLAVCILLAAVAFMQDGRAEAGNVLFHRAILAVIAAQFVQYALQIFYLRRVA